MLYTISYPILYHSFYSYFIYVTALTIVYRHIPTSIQGFSILRVPGKYVRNGFVSICNVCRAMKENNFGIFMIYATNVRPDEYTKNASSKETRRDEKSFEIRSRIAKNFVVFIVSSLMAISFIN